MNNSFSTEALLKKFKTNAFILNSGIPMGYVTGLPLLCILNGNLCMKIPYLKYQVTGETDKTLVFPVKYLVTMEIPEERIVGYEDFAFNEKFAKVDFFKPIGTFRHDAVKNLDKQAYVNLRSELYKEYDSIVVHLLYGGEYSSSNEERFSRLFNTMLEPCLHPFYHAIDKDFSTKYIIDNEIVK